METNQRSDNPNFIIMYIINGYVSSFFLNSIHSLWYYLKFRLVWSLDKITFVISKVKFKSTRLTTRKMKKKHIYYGFGDCRINKNHNNGIQNSLLLIKIYINSLGIKIFKRVFENTVCPFYLYQTVAFDQINVIIFYIIYLYILNEVIFLKYQPHDGNIDK